MTRVWGAALVASALGAVEAVGALGLLVGLAVLAIEVAASIGLVLFFVGAIVTVDPRRLVLPHLRSCVVSPPVTGSLVLQLAASRIIAAARPHPAPAVSSATRTTASRVAKERR